jgi:hypothetical protein
MKKLKLLLILFISIPTFAQDVEQWAMFEVKLQGPQSGNPYIDVDLSATFTLGDIEKTVSGFYDGNGDYKVRFMPSQTGQWTYTTSSSEKSLNAKSGAFKCVAATGNNHGPIRVRNTFDLAYEDGTPYYQIGTTCYAWTHQAQELQEQTLETLKNSPFNKIRMCVFPKDYIYNRNEPEFYVFQRDENGENDYTRFSPEYFEHFEKRILELQKLGIEADLILFHPYDRWGYAKMRNEEDDRYLKYLTARLSAFRNVWWSMANEFDLMKNKKTADWDRFCKVVYENDAYRHMLGVHNCRGFYNHNKPWITHASIQSSDFASAKKWREQYQMPLVFDECKYEGDITSGWGQLTPKQMTGMFWKSLITGTYAGHGETYHREDDILWWSKGGVLHGQSEKRIKFYKKYLEERPQEGYKPIDEYSAGVYGKYYLYYFDLDKPKEWVFDLPEWRNYQVEIIDTWNMTSKVLDNNYHQKFSIDLPGESYMAVKITAVGHLFPVAPITTNHDGGKFYKQTKVRLDHQDEVPIYYTLDGSEPDESSVMYKQPISVTKQSTFKAIAINNEGSKSKKVEIEFSPLSKLRKPRSGRDMSAGVQYKCYKGEFELLPEINNLKVAESGVATKFDLEKGCDEDNYFLDFGGYIKVPEDNVYTFYSRSDDGSKLWIGDELVVNNDGIHGPIIRSGQIALSKGFHPIRLQYFEGKHTTELEVSYKIAGGEMKEISPEMLFYSKQDKMTRR